MESPKEPEPTEQELRKELNQAEIIAILCTVGVGLAVISGIIAAISAIEVAIRNDSIISKISKQFLSTAELSSKQQLDALIIAFICSVALGIFSHVISEIMQQQMANARGVLNRESDKVWADAADQRRLQPSTKEQRAARQRAIAKIE